MGDGPFSQAPKLLLLNVVLHFSVWEQRQIDSLVDKTLLLLVGMCLLHSGWELCLNFKAIGSTFNFCMLIGRKKEKLAFGETRVVFRSAVLSGGTRRY